MHNHNIIQVETHQVHTLRISIGDALQDAGIKDADEVKVVLYSNALGREMEPVRLSWSAVRRLTEDVPR